MFHLARLQLDIHQFFALMRAGLFQVSRWPVPEDATLIQVTYDSQRHVFWAIFAHDSFPATMPGELLPELDSPIVSTWGGHR